MTLANSSVLIAPGAGATFATQLVAAKEHEVVVPATSYGHLRGSEPIYFFSTDPFTHSAVLSSDVFDFYNNAAAGTVVRIRSITHTILIEAAVVGVGIPWAIRGGSGTIPSGGTALTVRKLDSNDPVPDSGIIAQFRPSLPSVGLFFLSQYNLSTEEDSTNASYPWFQERLPPFFWKKGYACRVGDSFRINMGGAGTNIGASVITVFFSALVE